MPKLNAWGDVICGTAGMPGSRNGVYYPFASYGRGAWLDGGSIIFVSKVDNQIYVWRVYADKLGKELELVDRRATNFIAAGGGVYAAIGEDEQRRPVLFGTHGDKPGAGVADVALDGTTVYKTDYFGSMGLTLITIGGASVDIPNGYPVNFRAVPVNKVIWQGGAYGLDPLRPFYPDAQNVKLAELNGVRWLHYWSEEGGLILQPDGLDEGYVVERRPIAYDHDIVAFNGTVIIVSSRTAGEGPADYSKLTLNGAGLTYNVDFELRDPPTWQRLLRRTVPPPVPPTQPPVPPKPPVPPPAPPPKPPVPPPIPPAPQPVSLYQHHKEKKMASDTIGVLRGPGGKLGRPDLPNTGPWKGEGKGWRGLVFDGSDKNDSRYHFVRPSERQDGLISKETNSLLGADATVHSGGLDKQIYLKPDGDHGQGWGERWQFYDGNKNKAIMAVIEYEPGAGGDDGPFFGPALAFEVVQ
jgi:hypothetical protein